MPECSKWSLSLRFPHQNPFYTFPVPHTCYIRRPSLTELRVWIIFGRDYRSLSLLLCSLLHSLDT
jgi:hypothetical protein